MPKILPNRLVSPIRRLHGFLEWLNKPPYGDIDRFIRSGWTRLEIAYHLGRSPETIKGYIAHWGLPINPARWNRREYAYKILLQLDDGWSLPEVAALNLMSPAFLYRVVLSGGLEIPPHHLVGYEREVAPAIPGNPLYLKPPVLPPEWINAHITTPYSQGLIANRRLRDSGVREVRPGGKEGVPAGSGDQLPDPGPDAL